MKIITVETLKAFLDELNKKYGTEFYSKREIDEKLKSSGGSVDLKELARRIPSWQWKVTMPKTVNQTVTATVGSQTYTSDFYAPQGSNVTFSVKADDGFKAGTLSLEYDGMVVYAKVSPGASFKFDKKNEYAPGGPGEVGGYFDIFKIIYTSTQSNLRWQVSNPDERKMRATLEWSPEINEHAVDVDLTQPGVVRYIAF